MNKENNHLHFHLILFLIFNSGFYFAFAQNITADIASFDSTGYVEYLPGNLPIVISVPHGGSLEPDEIPDRDCNSFVCSKDLFTQELGRSIREAFFEQTGCYPHLVINLLHRRKFDANREIMEAADGNETVEQAFREYHAFLDAAKMQISEDYGRGLFLDLHGHAHNAQRLELGYRITKNELQLSDGSLNSTFHIEKSSIRALVSDNLLSLTHSELLRGENSFGTLLENRNVRAVPSSPDPFPIGNEGYFSGGYNTGRHGSENGGNIDGIQIECNQDIRLNENTRNRFADSLVATVNEFMGLHYNDQYEDNYCNLITNVSLSTVKNVLKIFPNPTKDYLYLDSNGDLEISIYNYLGRKVLSEIWHGAPIDIEFLKNGYYIVQIKKEKLIVGTHKLIKGVGNK